MGMILIVHDEDGEPVHHNVDDRGSLEAKCLVVLKERFDDGWYLDGVDYLKDAFRERPHEPRPPAGIHNTVSSAWLRYDRLVDQAHKIKTLHKRIQKTIKTRDGVDAVEILQDLSYNSLGGHEECNHRIQIFDPEQDILNRSVAKIPWYKRWLTFIQGT